MIDLIFFVGRSLILFCTQPYSTSVMYKVHLAHVTQSSLWNIVKTVICQRHLVFIYGVTNIFLEGIFFWRDTSTMNFFGIILARFYSFTANEILS